MKIITVIGARPNFIKAGAVSRVIRRNHKELIVHTGQHYDNPLSKVFFDELEIPRPDYNLGVGSGTHGFQTGEMIKRIEGVLLEEKPDIVLVYGDVNSTLAGAVAAVKLHIPIAHVEAGVRHYDRSVPEEVNRVLTDHISQLLFCPTKSTVDNLKKEGIESGVYFTGDVMLDSFLHNIVIAEERSTILKKLNLEPKNYLLATVHRASNTDNKKNLVNIFTAFSYINEKVVIPLHPRTKKNLEEIDFYHEIKNEKNIVMIDPLGYLDLLKIERHAKKILTDSGGIQREAYFLEIPCVTLRNYSPWLETFEDGWNILVEPVKYQILDAVAKDMPRKKSRKVFGNGNASILISEIIDNFKM